MNKSLPLFGSNKINSSIDSVIAIQGSTRITREKLHQDVANLLSTLPEKKYVINLCENRYHFLVGFVAALIRKQVNLLLPTRVPDFVAQVSQQYSSVYCLIDTQADFAGVEAHKIHFPTNPTNPTGYYDGSLSFPPDQLAAIAFTSGSTGLPQPNFKYWRSLVKVAQFTAQRLDMNSRATGSILATVPPQHMYGLETSIMLPLQTGYALHAHRPFFPEDIRLTLDELPMPRLLVTTPYHIRACIVSNTSLPALAAVISATATLPKRLAQQTEENYNTKLYEIFGFTEAGSVATRRTVITDNWTLFDAINFHYKNGYIYLQADYLQDQVVVNDIIELQSEKEFTLRGRKSDMVNIAGKRASLSHLNFKLNEISGVLDGTFYIPKSTDNKITRLMAFVVAPKKTAEDINNALRTKIDPAFLPRPLCLVKALPRNETGKLPLVNLSKLAQDVETSETQLQ